jgi:hypothetical protein
MANLVIRDLVQEVKAACADPRYTRLKEMWTRHNRLERAAKIPVSVHLHRGYTETWKELIPPARLLSPDPLARDVEVQLRQKLFRYHHIPDDDVVLPTLWFTPVRPAGQGPLWGVALPKADTHDPAGAYTFEAAVRDEADLAKLRVPRYEIDEAATEALLERVRELVDDQLPVKLVTDELFPNPTEHLVNFLGWDGFLYGFVERPRLVHRLLDFLTEGFISYQREREARGGVDAEGTWGYRVHYEELPPNADPKRLSSCWAYVAAQSTGTISPAMYAEFIHPYNERIVGLFGPRRIYYHGCEDLTPKIDIIATLPGLRRFHVSAWTDLATAVAKFECRVVLEAHVNPGKTVMVDGSAEMREDLRRIVAVAGDSVVDINLADIQTVRGDPSILTTWASIAQEVTSGL